MGNLIAALRGAPVLKTTPYGNPLPAVVHRVVQDHQLGGGRLVIVGDVHGCFDELQALLQQIQFQHGSDNLVFVGDLVNKGPKSPQVVSAVRDWAATGHTWSVRGNHCGAALAARRQLDSGSAPVKPKFHWVGQMSPEDVDFMQQLPFSLQIPGYKVAVVHAGLVPGLSLEQQQLKDMYKMRDLQQSQAANSQGWVALEKPAEGSLPWAQQWQGPAHVFFGHDAKRRLQLLPHATGLDTGCCYGGQLTACILPPLSVLQQSDEFAQSACPSLQQLQGQLASVQSNSVYEKPGRKSAEVLPASSTADQCPS